MPEVRVPAVVETAAGRRGRARGLLGRDSVPAGEALWISPCRQVHTFGMAFPIDVAFLDGTGRVLHTVVGMRPGRLSRIVWRAAGALEAAAGSLASWGVERGDVLAWD